jgi:hypothetical protein
MIIRNIKRIRAILFVLGINLGFNHTHPSAEVRAKMAHLL